MKKTTTNFLGYMVLATCLHQIVDMGNVYAAAQDIPQPRLSTTMKARMPLFGLTPEVHNHIMKRLLDESADQASLHSLLSQQGRANDMALVLSDAYLKAEPLMQTVAAYVAAPKETVAQSISSLSARSEAHENLGSITSADLHAFKNLLGSQHIEAPHKDAIRPIVEGLDIIISRSHAAAVEEDQALQASLKMQLSTLKNHFNPDQDTLETLQRQIDGLQAALDEKTTSFQIKNHELAGLQTELDHIQGRLDLLYVRQDIFDVLGQVYNYGTPEQENEAHVLLTHTNLSNALSIVLDWIQRNPVAEDAAQVPADDIEVAIRRLTDLIVQIDAAENLNAFPDAFIPQASAILKSDALSYLVNVASEEDQRLSVEINQTLSEMEPLRAQIVSVQTEVTALQIQLEETRASLEAAEREQADRIAREAAER
ncbi:MAG: hypothetical protein WCG05_05640, partial [Alphaproteobacteria bacterium]